MGVEILKKQTLQLLLDTKYRRFPFLSVGPFFEEGGRGSRKFRPEAEFFWIFSIEVAINSYWKHFYITGED